MGLKYTKRMICVGILLVALLALTGAGLTNTPVNHVPQTAFTDYDKFADRALRMVKEKFKLVQES